MNFIPITRRNNNVEILSKLMNSVAVKYDCDVKYNPEARTVRFFGDEARKPAILRETVAMFTRARGC